MCRQALRVLHRVAGEGGRVRCPVLVIMNKTYIERSRPACAVLVLCASFSPCLLVNAAESERDVVITASRMEQRADESLSDLSVIHRERLDLYGGQTLIDVLTNEAGLQVTRNGGAGGLSSAFIRGANSNQTLLLVDGVRLGDAFFSRPLLEDIPVESIERIEVLRGPASALYGSDAIGGVVQIFTRQQKTAWSRVTLGSDRHATLAAGAGGGQGPVYYQLSLNRTTERTFSATRPGTFTFAPDDDPFRLAGYNARVQWDFHPHWSLRGGHTRSVGRTHIDQGDATDVMGNFARSVDTRLRTRTDAGHFALSGTVRDGWRTRLQLSESRYKVALEQTPEGFGFPPFDNQNDSVQTQLAWLNDVQTAWGVMTLGAETLRQTIDSRTTQYTVRQREGEALFAGLTGQRAAHTWQGQARTDAYDEFGRRNTGLLAYGYAVTDSVRLKASAATSFRVPALIDQYFPFGSNPDLQPEAGRNLEVGADWRVGQHVARVNVFRHRVENLIALDENFIPQNVPEAALDGVSVSDEWTSGAWRVSGRLDFVDPVNRQTGRQLNRRAKESANLNVDYRCDSGTVGARVRLSGSRFDDAANRNELPGFGVLDVYASRRLSRQWTLTGRIDNALDKTYETVRFFRQAERRFFLTLAWSDL